MQHKGVRRKRAQLPPSDETPAKKHAVPHLIQGELARLDKKFRVKRDEPSADMEGFDDGQGLRLICILGKFVCLFLLCIKLHF